MLICWLLKVGEEITLCLQQSDLLFTEHGEYLLFLIMLFYFFTLLCSILSLASSSFKFLLRLKGTTLLIFGRDGLYVDTSEVFVSFEVGLSLSLKRSFLSSFSTFFICLFISSGLYPWLTNLCLSSSQYWLKSFSLVEGVKSRKKKKRKKGRFFKYT